MPKYEINPLQPKPEFDIMYFMEIAGESRIDQEIMDEFEPYWDKWAAENIKAYELKNTEGEGKFLLIYLDEEVDNTIEGIWQDSPTHGLLFHAMAITMVMSSAQGFVPELSDGKCAPLPRPGEGILGAFDELGLTWNDEGTVNRKYAVLTPYPYTGGCEVCYLSATCPKSTVAKQ
ncbi:hypothetical protein GM415_16475 [Pseudodesulfovibrio cashew]|uniref:Uncharacterized protein n=1 Tax=Pseudodesulfovibrio cashew TaxID=2678688 RepID=A0A6I6JKZ4_9BACT|nr:hypothetical protein [Pseudodesulfovibrio cashew]QGY41648.1 hypothetical protein GM415_16475 [Pseudodesulfovibrio cashew]